MFEIIISAYSLKAAKYNDTTDERYLYSYTTSNDLSAVMDKLIVYRVYAITVAPFSNEIM